MTLWHQCHEGCAVALPPFFFFFCKAPVQFILFSSDEATYLFLIYEATEILNLFTFSPWTFKLKLCRQSATCLKSAVCTSLKHWEQRNVDTHVHFESSENGQRWAANEVSVFVQTAWPTGKLQARDNAHSWLIMTCFMRFLGCTHFRSEWPTTKT